MIALSIELSLGCPSCHAPVALNAVVPSRTCDRCQRVCALPPELWAELMREPLLFLPTMHHQEQRDAPEDTAIGRVQRVFRRQAPTCSACGAAVDGSALAGASRSGACHCGQCGHRVSVREVPGIAGVRWVVGEERELLEGASTATREPLMAPCPQCAAPLRLDGSTRQVRCVYCNAHSQLPDDIWSRLHPTRPVRPFFLVVDPSRATGAAAAARVYPIETPNASAVDAHGHIYLCCDLADDGSPRERGDEEAIVSLDGETLTPRWVQRCGVRGCIALLDADRLVVWAYDTMMAEVNDAVSRASGLDDDEEQPEIVLTPVRFAILSTRDGTVLEKGRSAELAGFLGLSRADDGSMVGWRYDRDAYERVQIGGPPVPLFRPRPPEKKGFFARVFGKADDPNAHHRLRGSPARSGVALALPDGGIAFLSSEKDGPLLLRRFDGDGRELAPIEVPARTGANLFSRVTPIADGLFIDTDNGEQFVIRHGVCRPFHPALPGGHAADAVVLPDGRVWFLGAEQRAWLVDADGRLQIATEAARRWERAKAEES